MRPALLNVAQAHDQRVAFDPRRDEFAVDLDGLEAVDRSGPVPVIRHHSEVQIPVVVDHNRHARSPTV